MVTVDQFLEKYYRGEYPELRLGQAFVNEFGFKNMPDLFYQTNQIRALDMIFQVKADYQLP